MKEFFVTIEDSFFIETESEADAIRQAREDGWFQIENAQIYVNKEGE